MLVFCVAVFNSLERMHGTQNTRSSKLFHLCLQVLLSCRRLVRWPVCSLTERPVGGSLLRLFLFERIAARAHTGGKLSSVTRCRRGPWVAFVSSRTAHRLYSTLHTLPRGRRVPWVNPRTEPTPRLLAPQFTDPDASKAVNVLGRHDSTLWRG